MRTAVADWNPVPTGSMRPTILEGGVVFVNRVAYDFKLPLTDRILAHLGEPQRGDIVTFSSPADGARPIKRIAAVPGDTIEMRGNRLVVNGEAIDDVPLGEVVEPLAGTAGCAPNAHARRSVRAHTRSSGCRARGRVRASARWPFPRTTT
ncbi:signal peptidase I [Dokdonella sp.]|uniref:signal peptidase I n=1 Tax=Dokdonella sp. TaxID=2291710 RepID=UPI002617FEFE|nr:signal peptidase I [Dokdonella sp.]